MGSYSPHRSDGGTLHLPSPTHLHHDPASTLAQLRRSLSRSPSKGPTFRLVTSKSTSPSPSSPLSPSLSPLTRTASFGLLSNASTIAPSPLSVPFPPSARKTKQPARMLSPMRTSSRSTSLGRSPAKRALSVSTDNGNSTPPSPPLGVVGPENSPAQERSPESKSSPESGNGFLPSAASDTMLAPHHALSRRDKANPYFNDFPPKSSPLKRSDGEMRLDPTNVENPSAKRRSLHGVSFGADFNIFDQAAALGFTQMDSNGSQSSDVTTFFDSGFSTMPKRSSSLRKTTLQQRHEKPALARSKPSHDLNLDFYTPAHVSKGRSRLSLDHVLPLPARESPFSLDGSLPSASIHPISQTRNEVGPIGLQPSQRHPLSRTMTQSSSGSSIAEDSPTHIPFRNPDLRQRSVDLSKSLPLGSLRPIARETSTTGQSSSGESSFATPENYKLAKPLPAAFMSTGLISKKSKDIMNDPNLDLNGSIGHMPDTPCKKPVSMNAIAPIPTPGNTAGKHRHGHRSLHSFGTPSTPFNPHPARPGAFGRGVSIFGSSYTNGGKSRRGSFLSIDGDENSQSEKFDSQSTADFDVPPTPTKQVVGSGVTHSRHVSSQGGSANGTQKPGGSQWLNASDEHSPRPEQSSSPIYNRLEPKSPRTPQETYLPPDPSGLSISTRGGGLATQSMNEFNFSSSFLPATPTGPRDSFLRFSRRSSIPILHNTVPPAVDSSITSRFDKVEMIGTGEFSEVFRVAKKQEFSSSQSYFALPATRSTPKTPLPDLVWAVKKSRQPFIGPKDRLRKLQEVQILKALGRGEHTLELFDSWESNDHLYIQTDYCEEGSLDLFLHHVGRKARLDDFRIWKILLELSQGLKHIHDSGFIHLDLKPANILITFEGALKIGDFGMATTWPAPRGIDGEGDREYIGPEILMGQYDKPADIFALGLIMLEIAGNVVLPDNGLSWQRLRSGDMSDVPSLTWSSDATNISRDSSGKPLIRSESFDELYGSEFGNADFRIQNCKREGKKQNLQFQLPRAGELVNPPSFMTDPNHDEALDKLVRWMISPQPSDRPVIGRILAAAGVRWAETRRRAGATIYEGNWGPTDEILQDDAEMIDV